MKRVTSIPTRIADQPHLRVHHLSMLPPRNERALAPGPTTSDKGRVRLMGFPGIVAYLSDREIDELQAAIDARPDARTRVLRDDGAAMPQAKPRTSVIDTSPE
jgi:hypothetical protein